MSEETQKANLTEEKEGIPKGGPNIGPICRSNAAYSKYLHVPPCAISSLYTSNAST